MDKPLYISSINYSFQPYYCILFADSYHHPDGRYYNLTKIACMDERFTAI